MNKKSLKFLSVLLCGIIIVATVFCTATGTAFAQTSYNAVSVEQIREVANGIIEWKKSDVGSDNYLINDVLLRQARSTPGD